MTLNTAPQNKYGGLKRKYIVFKSDTGEPVEGSFVLRPDRDAAARIALEAYAKATENKELADDIIRWIGDSGKTVLLPCKVGDTVYRIHTKDHVEKHRVIAFHVSASGLWFWDENGRETPVETIGKTVFITREEAEAALKGERT